MLPVDPTVDGDGFDARFIRQVRAFQTHGEEGTGEVTWN